MDTSTVRRSVIQKPKLVKVLKTKARKKKDSRRLIELQLDLVVKEIVLARDDGCVCRAPLKGHSLSRQPGHLISRKNRAVRWSLLNVSEQCSSCNLLHNFKPEIYTSTFIAKWGGEKYYSLVSDSYEVMKYQPYELQELLEQLNKIRVQQILDPKFKPYFTQKEILSGAWIKEKE